MPQFPVQFTFHAGISRPVFQNVRLVGSWDGEGRHSEKRSAVDMVELHDEFGCPAFRAVVSLDADQKGWLFRWGVMADTPGTRNRCGDRDAVGRTLTLADMARRLVGIMPAGFAPAVRPG
jgi:1,4-alpha-glucan branching enzyme